MVLDWLNCKYQPIRTRFLTWSAIPYFRSPSSQTKRRNKHKSDKKKTRPCAFHLSYRLTAHPFHSLMMQESRPPDPGAPEAHSVRKAVICVHPALPQSLPAYPGGGSCPPPSEVTPPHPSSGPLTPGGYFFISRLEELRTYTDPCTDRLFRGFTCS